LVHDPGYGDSDACHHSTITINGEDQIKARSGKYLGFGSGKGFHYLANDLSDAYGEASLDRFIRHLLFARQGYLVLVDEIKLKKEGKLEWRLQTRHAAEVVDGRHALIRGEEHRMHVLDAGDEMVASVVDWEGKNGKLNAVTKTPGTRGQELLVVTVLFPVKEGAGAGLPPPAATFRSGKLTVSAPDGSRDLICFNHDENRWVLDSFNDEDASGLGDGSNRSLESFRNLDSNEIPVEEFPVWFLPVNGKK
jgi:hypothetical protein